MSKRVARPQKNQIVDAEEKPVVVNQLSGLDDRKRNPKDLDPDEGAMAAGVEHGGTFQSRHEFLGVRGDGGRKRSGPRHKGDAGRDISKRR